MQACQRLQPLGKRLGPVGEARSSAGAPDPRVTARPSTYQPLPLAKSGLACAYSSSGMVLLQG